MGWTNTDTNELVVPANEPFAAGNDVIGIGTELPPELAAANVNAAAVFYNSHWDPTATTPRVKFMFIGTSSNATATVLALGMGICQNPSVNTTAVITQGFAVGMQTLNGVGQTFVNLARANDTLSWIVFNHDTGNPEEDGYKSDGTTVSWTNGGA